MYSVEEIVSILRYIESESDKLIDNPDGSSLSGVAANAEAAGMLVACRLFLSKMQELRADES